jgi:hypothetical protein
VLWYHCGARQLSNCLTFSFLDLEINNEFKDYFQPHLGVAGACYHSDISVAIYLAKFVDPAITSSDSGPFSYWVFETSMIFGCTM